MATITDALLVSMERQTLGIQDILNLLRTHMTGKQHTASEDASAGFLSAFQEGLSALGGVTAALRELANTLPERGDTSGNFSMLCEDVARIREKMDAGDGQNSPMTALQDFANDLGKDLLKDLLVDAIKNEFGGLAGVMNTLGRAVSRIGPGLAAALTPLLTLIVANPLAAALIALAGVLIGLAVYFQEDDESPEARKERQEASQDILFRSSPEYQAFITPPEKAEASSLLPPARLAVSKAQEEIATLHKEYSQANKTVVDFGNALVDEPRTALPFPYGLSAKQALSPTLAAGPVDKSVNTTIHSFMVNAQGPDGRRFGQDVFKALSEHNYNSLTNNTTTGVNQ